ncbi:hypothetical protein BJ322DRAFT_292345 [Thelephora terrestris]|uniref:Uncharacterized protein n=1 Tax=Thelephora terrestris TaxID=56493 RepID=A0A9P6H6A6_9AGAM|nr:hypothetical protein BJ322DRAFT_292345 [Thelephora terrestris]
MIMIHALVTRRWISDHLWCEDRPSSHEHITLARDFTAVALAEYQRVQGVPHWILHFALNSLSLNPLPPAPVVADCLTMIAIDLGCDISNIAALHESVQVEQFCTLITQKLQTMVEAGDPDPINSKRLAICTLLPYAIFLEQGGQRGVVDAIICAARASTRLPLLYPIHAYFVTLFGKPSSPFLNQVIVLVSPHIDWEDIKHGKEAVVGWAAAVTEVADTEEVTQSVVDTLLQIAATSLRPHIPIKIWAWMKKQPSLPPVCGGRSRGTRGHLVSSIQELRDLELLKSYFLLVWSEWEWPYYPDEMELSIREDFGGIGMWGHREDLIKRLYYVLEQLDQGLEYLVQHNPYIDQINIEMAKPRYRKLQDVLLDVDSKTMKTLTQSHSTFMCALHHPCL